MRPPQDADYIGDGVYASLEHGMIWLRTQREGWHEIDEGWHEIALEPEVYEQLVQFAKRAWNLP